MKIHNYPGFFVAIEGLDGSGSDDIAKSLVRKLKKEGLPVVAAKEPTKGSIGQVIKNFLLQKKRPLSPLLLEFLFAADRAFLLEEKVIPSLKKSELVLSDRCLWSSIAYRSLELPTHWLLEINTRFIIPDLTYFIDVSPSICASQIKKGEDEVQIYDEEERLSQIQDGYHWIFNKYPFWFRVVDGEREKKEVVEEILTSLHRHRKFKRIKKK